MTRNSARRRFIGWAGLVLLSAYAAAALQSGIWEMADQFYQKGDYAKAAEAYQSLLTTSPANPFLHYYLANAYFKQGSSGTLGLAIAEYWRAYELLPRNADIRYNLDFALRKAGETLVPSGIPAFIHRMFYLLSERELAGLFWIAWWICLVGGGIYLLASERPRIRLRPLVLTSLFAAAASGSWWGLRRLGDIPNMGVVLEANAEARSGPGANFSVSFNAPEGRRVSIVSQQGDWTEIDMLKEGLRGWVPSKAVEPIDKS